MRGGGVFDVDNGAPEQVLAEIELLGELRIDDLLRRMGELNASDLYLIHGRPPEFRVAGRLVHHESLRLNGTVIGQLADRMMEGRHQQEFKDSQRADIAYAIADVGRFRVNVYSQRGSTAIVIRRVNTEVPSFEELGLPPVAADLALAPPRAGAGHGANRVREVHDARGHGPLPEPAAVRAHRHDRRPH
jgi:hypothetical protein